MSVRASQEDPAFLLTCHPDTVALYGYWREKRGERLMPRRSDIDPTEIPPRLLPGITLNTTPDDYTPLRDGYLMPFNGEKFVVISDLMKGK